MKVSSLPVVSKRQINIGINKQEIFLRKTRGSIGGTLPRTSLVLAFTID
jgi:hypothetical protein